jgi:hypothetical protein
MTAKGGRIQTNEQFGLFPVSEKANLRQNNLRVSKIT